MEVLTSLVAVAAVVLALSAVAKLRSPRASLPLLRALRIPGGAGAVRALGVGELAVAVGTLAVGGPVFTAALGALYAIFAVVVVLARRADAPSCGCFGTVSAPPGRVHLHLDVVSAAVAFAGAVAGSGPALDAAPDQFLAAVAWGAGIATAAWLVVVLDTTGAEVDRAIQAAGGVRT